MNETGEDRTEVSHKLDSLLNYENPNEEEILDVVNGDRQYTDLGTQYSEALFLRIEDDKELYGTLRDRLKGEVLVDLGGGRDPHFMEGLAVDCQADTFIDVDRCFKEKEVHREGQTDVIYLPKDMLGFTSKLQSDSSSFAICGIDMAIIYNKRYHEMLATEVVRATKQNGIIMLEGSAIYHFIQGNPRVNRISPESKQHWSVFEKK